MQKLLTPWRLKWYPRFILFALAAGFLTAILSGDGAYLAGRLGGDYPAFYSAGRIIAEGDWENLYSAEKQASVQKALFPGDQSSFLVFVNPPFWAAAYFPLSLLDYRISYLVHTVLMGIALLGAVWLISSANQCVKKYYLLFCCLSLTFYPLFRALLGSQNTTLTLLLILLAWRLVSANREWLGGIILGLLLFKPQFALPLIALHLLSGRWRVALGSLPVAALLYGAGYYISGPSWISEWLNYAHWASRIDAGVNADKAVCLLGFFQAVLGPESRAAVVVGLFLAVLTSLLLAFLWFKEGRDGNYTALMGITASALVLLPPHVMYYDAGILMVTLAAWAITFPDGFLKPFYWIWSLGFSQLLAAFLGFSPLFLITVATLFFSIRFSEPGIRAFEALFKYFGCCFEPLRSNVLRRRKYDIRYSSNL